WLAAVDRLEAFRARVMDRPGVALDGRMQPHEWLATGADLLKLDGLDHHCDHFYPGRQDMAWDLAGAILEFGLGAQASQRLLARYRVFSGDGGAKDCLPFYRAAYLAFRLG